MENSLDISLGRKNWYLRTGSFITLIFLTIVIVITLNIITIQDYKKVEILSTSNSFYMDCDTDLSSTLLIRLGNNSILKSKIYKVDRHKFKIVLINSRSVDLQYLKEHFISPASILVGKKTLLSTMFIK